MRCFLFATEVKSRWRVDSFLHPDLRYHPGHDHHRLPGRPHRPQVGIRHHRLDHVCALPSPLLRSGTELLRSVSVWV